MATELEKILGEGQEPTPPSEEKKPDVVTPPEENPEVKQKAEHLANIQAAIKAEEDKLKKIRQEQKLARQGLPQEEEELPQIDLKDPSAKAWDKRIQDASSPARQELDKAKEERRLFTLKQFLQDKPALAKNPEKIKAMMETYDRLKTSTELTNEGIMMDLEKAYAAEHSDELINIARQTRVENARNDAIFSDSAVSRGSTAYSEDKPTQRTYSEDEKSVLMAWGMTPAEHALMTEEMRKKAQ